MMPGGQTGGASTKTPSASRGSSVAGSRPASRSHEILPGGSKKRAGGGGPTSGSRTTSRAGSATGSRQGDAGNPARPATGMSHFSFGNNALDQSFATTMNDNLSSVEKLRMQMDRIKVEQERRDRALALGVQDSALWYTRRNLPPRQDATRGLSIRRDGTIKRRLALFKGIVQVLMLFARVRIRLREREREQKRQRKMEDKRKQWEDVEDEKVHGTNVQRVVLGQSSERVQLQKEWLQAREQHRTRKLVALRRQWAEQYEENLQWPFRIVSLKSLITTTRTARKEAETIIAELANSARTEARMADLKGVSSAVFAKTDVAGAMQTLAGDTKAMREFNVENDVVALRKLKEASDDEIKRLKILYSSLREQARAVEVELKEQREILRKALEPFVKERTELKKQWAQWRERDWLLTQEKVDIEVGFREKKFAEFEEMRKTLFARRVEVVEQEEKVAMLDQEVMDLEKQMQETTVIHTTKVSAAQKEIRRQLGGLRSKRAFNKAWEERAPEREKARAEAKFRIAEMEREEEEQTNAIDRETDAIMRLRKACLAVAMRLPRCDAVNAEFSRQNLEMVVTLDYPTLATTMKEYVAAVEDGDDVDFNAAVGWVQCRHPFVEGLDKPTKEMKSMLDDAFEAAFQDDEDLSDAAKVKELKAELTGYGLEPDEMRGMGIIQLQKLLADEKAAVEGITKEEKCESESESEKEEEEEEEEDKEDEKEEPKQEEEEEEVTVEERMDREARGRAVVPDMKDDSDDEALLAKKPPQPKAAPAKAESSDSEEEDNRDSIQKAIDDAKKAAAELDW